MTSLLRMPGRFAWIIAALALLIQSAPAQEAGKEKEAKPEKEAKQDKAEKQRGRPGSYHRLGLSEEQEKKFEQLSDAATKQRIELRAKISSSRVDLRSLLRADKPDRNAIIAKQKEISGFRDQIAAARVGFWFDANALLTPEQQEIWKRHLRAGEGHDGGGRDGRGWKGKLRKFFDNHWGHGGDGRRGDDEDDD